MRCTIRRRKGLISHPAQSLLEKAHEWMHSETTRKLQVVAYALSRTLKSGLCDVGNCRTWAFDSEKLKVSSLWLVNGNDPTVAAGTSTIKLEKFAANFFVTLGARSQITCSGLHRCLAFWYVGSREACGCALQATCWSQKRLSALESQASCVDSHHSVQGVTRPQKGAIRREPNGAIALH